jgi:type VI protein secretion system component VasF
VLLGFDLEGQRLQPTRAAALWVVFGLAVFAGLVAFGAYTAITAAQP